MVLLCFAYQLIAIRRLWKASAENNASAAGFGAEILSSALKQSIRARTLPGAYLGLTVDALLLHRSNRASPKIGSSKKASCSGTTPRGHNGHIHSSAKSALARDFRSPRVKTLSSTSVCAPLRLSDCF